MKNNDAYLSLGSNLGDRLGFLKSAVSMLRCECLGVEKISAAYETVPQDFENQPDFLNCVLKVATPLDPFELLALCRGVEDAIGRSRTVAFGPRTIDIDILLFNGDSISTEHLTVPHPRMDRRKFVLVPLAEIAPNCTVGNWSVAALLEKCPPQRVLRVCDFPLMGT
jgi:2-amino-4-hydroxy-6-hydroxymethyldihydropteridine diphosphokinase